MKTSIMDKVNKIADYLADVIFDPDEHIDSLEAEHREQFAGSLKADISIRTEPVYCRDYASIFPEQERPIFANRMEDRQRVQLVCQEFDPDSQLHQRYLVKATRRNYLGGTDAIQTAMTKVGVELTSSQAFSALCEHVSILQAKGVEL